MYVAKYAMTVVSRSSWIKVLNDALHVAAYARIYKGPGFTFRPDDARPDRQRGGQFSSGSNRLPRRSMFPGVAPVADGAMAGVAADQSQIIGTATGRGIAKPCDISLSCKRIAPLPCSKRDCYGTGFAQTQGILQS